MKVVCKVFVQVHSLARRRQGPVQLLARPKRHHRAVRLRAVVAERELVLDDLRLPQERDLPLLLRQAVEARAKGAQKVGQTVEAAAPLEERSEVRQEVRRGEDARAGRGALLQVPRMRRRVRAQEELGVACAGASGRSAVRARAMSLGLDRVWRQGERVHAPSSMTFQRASRSAGNLATGLQKL